MPVLEDSKPVTFTQLPTAEELEKAETKDQVFYIPFTDDPIWLYCGTSSPKNHHSKTIHELTELDYFNRMLFYRRRCWICSETLKKGLTFKEALESERKARLRAEPIFPSIWIKPALEIIHLNKSTLNDLIDEVYDYFRGTRFVSEHVFVDVPTTSGSDRSVERAVILEKVANTVPITLEKRVGDKRQIQRELREAAEDNSRVPEDHYHYRIQLFAKPNKVYVVAPNQMRRPRQILSKITLKKYIKDVARKDKWIGAPWIVKSSLVSRYGLVSEIPLDPNDPTLKDKKGKLKPLAASLFEHPIEDTELLVGPLVRKPEEKITVKEEDGVVEKSVEKIELPTRPLPSRDFGSVSSNHVLSLISSFSFLQIFGRPLRLYPFQFDTFLRHLSHTNYHRPSEIISESFGALLSIACHEYQSKFDSASGVNPLQMGGLVKPDSNGDWSQEKHVNEAIGKVMEEYKTFTVHEKVAVDQWYKWRSGQWLSEKKKTSMDHIKAWPVALFGLIKDTISDEGGTNVFKWNLLLKLLGPPPKLAETDELPDDPVKKEDEEVKDEEMQVDQNSEMDVEMNGTLEDEEIDQLPDSEHGSDGDYEKRQSDEEDELEWDGEDTISAPPRGSIRGTSTRPVLPSEQIKPPPKPKQQQSKPTQVKKKATPKVKAPPVMGFEALCIRMEKSFWNFTPNEKVYLLHFIIDELLYDSKLLSNFRDECFEKVTELKKEQREINRLRRGIVSSLSELDKVIKKLVLGAAAVDPVVPEEIQAIESDASDDDANEGRPVRTTRLSRVKRAQILEAKAAAEEPVVDSSEPATEEQLEIQQEKKDLLARDVQLQRRYNIIDFEIRNVQAGARLRILGRDRFCNRYWYFDAAHGSVSLEAITKAPFEPSLLKKPVGVDPDIPYDYSTGVLFVEDFGVSTLTPALLNEFSDLRLGLVDGTWGYYSTVQEFEQLKQWLDRRGIRESTLYHNLENFSDYITDGMEKRNDVLQDEVQKSQDAINARKSLRISTHSELMDEAFGYENWWQ